MQCDDILEVPKPKLDDLDAALNELGMLAGSADSRAEYLNEIRNKQYLNMLINTKYVSNVSIGLRVRPVAPHVRYKPYKLPKERHRTRSENNDNEPTVSSLAKTIVESCIDQSFGEMCQLKKAKSLESIIAESGGKTVDLKNITLGNPNELEQVSHSIQNLRVVE